MKLDSRQEKERRNILIFCTAIIIGKILDINIQDITLLGIELKKLSMERIMNATYLILLYFTFTQTVITLYFFAEIYETHKKRIIEVFKENEIETSYDEDGEISEIRVLGDTNKETRLKTLVNQKKANLKKLQFWHEILDRILILAVPYVLILTAFLVI